MASKGRLSRAAAEKAVGKTWGGQQSHCRHKTVEGEDCGATIGTRH